MLFTSRNNPMLPYKLQINNENSLINSNFNSKHNTIILIHGFTESASMSFAKTISTGKKFIYSFISIFFSLPKTFFSLICFIFITIRIFKT